VRRVFLLVPLVAALIGAPPAHAAAPLEGVPQFDHVFTIVLENQNFADTWDTPGPGGHPTYLQTLRAAGAFASQYYGVGHVSADNYIAMTSGQLPTPPFEADCVVSWGICKTFEKLLPDHGRNIADEVQERGKTWRAYMDGMQVPCQHPPLTALRDPYQTGYATRHNPFVYYPDIVENTARCNSHVVPYKRLAVDLTSAATTPNYVFITPDTCHDGHDAPCVNGAPGGLFSANAWLEVEVPKILASPAFTTQRSLLIVTFDENGFSDVQGCCGILAGGPLSSTWLALGGRIGLVAVGTGITPGKEVATPFDHWSYVRTVEDALGIRTHLNIAGLPITHPMAELFAP
jgi:hypothetical protein